TEPIIAQHIRWDTLAYPERDFGFREGQTIPNLQMEDVYGTTFDLYDRKEELLLLDFWFIACKPCVQNKRYLRSFERQYDLHLVSISVDHRASTVKKYIDEHGIRWTNVQDDAPFDRRLKNRIGIDPSYPDYILIGPDQEVLRIFSSGSSDIGSLGVFLQGYFEGTVSDTVPDPLTGMPEEHIRLSSDLLFEFDRAELLQAAFPVLDSLFSILEAAPERKVEIQGHTDNIGSMVYNLDLSRQRAEAVRRYLLGKGIAPERLRAVGFGSEQPLQSNASTEGRQANRRVEVVLR
ncbi:MAG: OmpA family protein, partial [Phaeodactylibacter sp.]|nr:OmpA family protein [Phaeodactylibacter sp.]